MFSKIISLLKKFRMPLLLVVIAIGCALSLAYLSGLFNKSESESYTSQLGKEMVFFSMNGCGHCDNMMPAWKQLVSNYGSENAYIEYKHVVAQERPDLIEKYGVQSFPTILALKDGEIAKKYEGDRSYEDLLRFSNYAMSN